MEKDDDPWEILGVPRDASETEIKKAFRKGALKYHPDRQQTEEDKAAAHDIFAKFSAAYETLNDPVKRYDWKLAEEKRKPRPVQTKKQPVAPKDGTRKQPPVATRQAPPTKPPPNRAPRTPDIQPKKGPTGTAPVPQKKPSTSSPVPGKKHPTPKSTDASPAHPPRKTSLTPPGPVRKVSTDPAQQQKSMAQQQRVPGPRPLQATPPQKGRPITPPKAQKSAGKPVVLTYRDPFDIFDSVMKEEYGENYKDRDDSGWKGSIGVPGLAKINPFKNMSESSKKEFKKLDVNNDKSLSRDELAKFIQSRSELWSALGVTLNLPVKKCVEVATDVAFSLAYEEGKARPKKVEHRTCHELSEAEFKYFHKNYVLDEKGSHEFYLRTIFAVFDLNNDGVLNAKELDKFLDIFYKAKDIFKGDMKLPEKKQLLKIVGTRLDGNKDGVLQFEEIRDLLEVAAVVSTEKG